MIDEQVHDTLAEKGEEPNPPASEPRDILIVCRANRGRSPATAFLLRREAARRGINVPIRDAGLYVDASHRPIARLDLLVRSWGLEMEGRQPTAVTLDQPDEVALLITFETALKHDLASLQPMLVDRIFTLRELVRLSSSPAWEEVKASRAWSGGPPRQTDKAVHSRVDALVHSLHRLRPLVDPGNDDTPDPAAVRRKRAMRKLLQELTYDTERIASLLWGSSPSSGAAGSSAARSSASSPPEPEGAP